MHHACGDAREVIRRRDDGAGRVARDDVDDGGLAGIVTTTDLARFVRDLGEG